MALKKIFYTVAKVAFLFVIKMHKNENKSVVSLV